MKGTQLATARRYQCAPFSLGHQNMRHLCSGDFKGGPGNPRGRMFARAIRTETDGTTEASDTRMGDAHLHVNLRPVPA